MPIYEYRCTACGTVFARLQSISNPGKDNPCPKCECTDTERVLSTFAAGSSASTAPSFPSAPGCGGGGGG
ncbi:MAG: zinc ribbon domain-containing protein [Candidatus Sulfomarinibacteraceae bacterium]